MDKRVRLQCKECGCVMEFPTGSFKAEGSLRCPNCENKLSGDSFNLFGNAIDSIRDLPTDLSGTIIVKYDTVDSKGFHVSISMDF